LGDGDIRKKTGKTIAILLALALVLSALPGAVFAMPLLEIDPPVEETQPEDSLTESATDPSVTFTITSDSGYGNWLFLPQWIPVTDATLLSGVSAVDENGDPVAVSVLDAGGLDMQSPQPQPGFPPTPYTITFEATHPVTGDTYTTTRDVYVTVGIMPLASSATEIDLSEDNTGATYANWSYNALLNTYTINGPVTVIGTVTGATTGLAFYIASGVTADWQASFSTSMSSYALTLSGTGTFNVDSGGLIANNGTGGAISVSGSTLNVNGGTVNSPGSGIAIFNDSFASSAINIINDGTVTAGNSSAIQANSAGTVVEIKGGTVTNAATSNINPTINMSPTPASDPTFVNVIVGGSSVVQTTNPSSTSYVIQTAANVTIGDSAQVTALAGRAINLIGTNSTATVNDNAVVSATSGIAISTATTTVGAVSNAQIIVNGGVVSTSTGTAAIQTTGANGRVTINGGQVTATSGLAIKATNTVTVNGGFVFAYGINIGQVVSAPNTNFPTGGVVAAWNNAALNPLYVERTANDLVILPANPASPPNNVYWHNSGALINGIQYSSSNASGFFQLPVTVTQMTSDPSGLIFNIADGQFYIGTISASTVYIPPPGDAVWASGTLTLTDFKWSTTAPIALTITGGTNINIILNGSNTFVTTNTVPGGAGIISGASISIASTSTGTLNASASAGMGIDCGANNLTMNGGTVNATAGNGANTHGLNVGTLTINGGALNASSGGPATTGAFFGINAARLVVTDGSGVVTASGNSRAINSAALSLPAGYQYSKGTKPDGSNKNTFMVPNDPAYVYSANNSYVQIEALKQYTLTVVADGIPANGTIVGSFYPGQTVTVTAAIDSSGGSPYNLGLGPVASTQGPPSSYPLSINVFKDWVSSAGGAFADATSQTTDFTMPGNDVTVTAESQIAYKLWTSGAHIVNPQNLGSQALQLGYYLQGTEVLLGSNASSSYSNGYTFDGWTESLTAPNGTTIPGGGDFSSPNSSTTVYTMPAANAYVQAPWSFDPAYASKPLDYTLTVTDGTGSVSSISAGTWVNIVADPPLDGYEFDCWMIIPPAPEDDFTGYPGAFLNINSSATQFIMGERNITVTAVYKPILYNLIVVDGTDLTDEGPYAEGYTIVVEADPPPPMYEFSHWEIEYGMTLASAANDFFDNEFVETSFAMSAFNTISPAQIATLATSDFFDNEVEVTSFTMPAGHTTVTAIFTKVYFELTVVDGLGSGVFKGGDLVVVTASAPPGLVFDHWEVTSGGAAIGNASSLDAIVTMPGRDVTITAVFRTDGPQIPGGSYYGQGDSGSSATGDNSNMPAWWIALVVSLFGIAFIGRRFLLLNKS